MYLVEGADFQILSYGIKRLLEMWKRAQGVHTLWPFPVSHCQWLIIGGLFSFCLPSEETRLLFQEHSLFAPLFSVKKKKNLKHLEIGKQRAESPMYGFET